MPESRYYAMSGKDVWQTPDEVLSMLQQHLCIDLDPCAAPDTDIGTHNLRLEDGDDGLEASWSDVAGDDFIAFVNPPFSEKSDWTDKIEAERDDAALIVLLLPDATDVKSYWHGTVVEYAQYVWFSEGRIGFYDPIEGEKKDKPSFGTTLSFFGEVPDSLLETLSQEGWVVEGWDS